MLGSIVFGPLLVKEAVNGAGLVCNTVFAGISFAVGLLVELMYRRIFWALIEETAVAGRTWASAAISAPLAAEFPRINPAPPALFTSMPLPTLVPFPLKQRTIFPFTFLEEREPGRH